MRRKNEVLGGADELYVRIHFMSAFQFIPTVFGDIKNWVHDSIFAFHAI